MHDYVYIIVQAIIIIDMHPSVNIVWLLIVIYIVPQSPKLMNSYQQTEQLEVYQQHSII